MAFYTIDQLLKQHFPKKIGPFEGVASYLPNQVGYLVDCWPVHPSLTLAFVPARVWCGTPTYFGTAVRKFKSFIGFHNNSTTRCLKNVSSTRENFPFLNILFSYPILPLTNLFSFCVHK